MRAWEGQPRNDRRHERNDAQRGIRKGVERAWTIRDRVTGQLLGTTRFLGVDLKNARLEIGSASA